MRNFLPLLFIPFLLGSDFVCKEGNDLNVYLSQDELTFTTNPFCYVVSREEAKLIQGNEKYYKIEVSDIVEMTKAEKDKVDQDELKAIQDAEKEVSDLKDKLKLLIPTLTDKELEMILK